MLKKIKNNYLKLLILFGCFILFFILYRVTPMMYDGWWGKFNYAEQNGILSYIKYVFVGYYMSINGRIVSNIFCGIMESFSSEIPLDLFNTLMLVGIYICLIIIYIKKDKKIGNSKFFYSCSLFVSLILLVSNAIRNEVLLYANMAYVVPIFMILLYYIILYYTY